jgi:uncharacterized protein (TIGR01777 family)
MRILITGATGMVGTALLQRLRSTGHESIAVSRQKGRSDTIYWDPASGEFDLPSMERFDAAVHLAGENIAAGRWTTAQKERIRDSRIRGTRLLSESIAKLQHPPRVLISASAIGYYGDRGDEILREESSPGTGFLPDVCRQWEAATDAATRRGVRVVHPRFGIILSARSGALAKMLPPFKMGIGGRIGSGRQYMSWITLEDACGVILHAIEAEGLHGAVNAVSPNPVTNQDFTSTLGRVLYRPTIFPLPAFAARILLGEMADALLLASARVEPAKLRATRYAFRFAELEPALRYLIGRN